MRLGLLAALLDCSALVGDTATHAGRGDENGKGMNWKAEDDGASMTVAGIDERETHAEKAGEVVSSSVRIEMQSPMYGRIHPILRKKTHQRDAPHQRKKNTLTKIPAVHH